MIWKIILAIVAVLFIVWLLLRIWKIRSRRSGWIDFINVTTALSSEQMPVLASEFEEYIQKQFAVTLSSQTFAEQMEFLLTHAEELKLPAGAEVFPACRLPHTDQSSWIAMGAYIGELVKAQHPQYSRWAKRDNEPPAIEIDYRDGVVRDTFSPFRFLYQVLYAGYPELAPSVLRYGYRHMIRAEAVNTKRGLRLTPEEVQEWEEIIVKHFGTIRNVFHELVSPDIHCDIYVVDPPDQAKVYLITGGMSGYLMPVPDELQADGVPERLELMVTLPAEWPLTYKDLRNKANYWPIQMLKDLARYPVENFQMLNNGHTVGMPKPYGDTKFTAALLRTPGQLSPKTRFRLSAEVETGLLQLIPILPEEREYLASHGSEGYVPFENLDPMISPHRPMRKQGTSEQEI